jgi:hypothetical protein
MATYMRRRVTPSKKWGLMVGREQGWMICEMTRYACRLSMDY